MDPNLPVIFPDIKKFLNSLDISAIPDHRKEILQEFTDFIQSKISTDQDIRINFICTHNSRRSHFSQVWAQAIGSFFNIKNLICYSGGTQATALYPVVVKVLEDSGFKIKLISKGKNPVHSIKFSENEHPVIGFSKTFDEQFNPKSGFLAVMTCSQADGNCPFISGAEKRLALAFEDPGKFDNSSQQIKKYKESSIEIATELFFVFSKIRK